MVFLDMGDDPIPHHHRIRLEGCAPVVAEDIPVTDPADEPLRTVTLSEPHDEGSIAAGLPWDGRIQSDQPRIAYEVEITHQFANDLCCKERRTVPSHRIGVIDCDIHINGR